MKKIEKKKPLGKGAAHARESMLYSKFILSQWATSFQGILGKELFKWQNEECSPSR